MSARKQVDWRTSHAGHWLSRRVDSPINNTLQSALQLMDAGGMSARASTAVNLEYDAHGAAIYVCAVISVYALFVVVFVAILFVVRRRRHPKLAVDGGGALDGYLATVGRPRDPGGRKPPLPPPPPPPPALARRRSDSSTSSVSPVRRSSRGARRCAAAGSRWRVDELVAPPRRRSTNDAVSRRASPVDDVITLIQVYTLGAVSIKPCMPPCWRYVYLV